MNKIIRHKIYGDQIPIQELKDMINEAEILYPNRIINVVVSDDLCCGHDITLTVESLNENY